MEWMRRKKIRYLGLPLLFAAMIAEGGTVDNSASHDSSLKSFSNSGESANEQPFNNIKYEFLSVEALVDTEENFEALLFDHQSQENIGHLYFNQNDKEGKIAFEYGGIKDQISLQIGTVDEMTLSERYKVLLRGLEEAGIAWISQYKKEPPLQASDKSAPQDSYSIAATMRYQPVGRIDKVKPKIIKDRGLRNKRINRKRFINGWAYDPDVPARSIYIHVYAKKFSTSKSTLIATVYANKRRPDVNRTMRVPGNHGWRYKIPEGWDADHVRDKPGICRNRRNNGMSEDYCSVQYSATALDFGVGRHINSRLPASFYEHHGRRIPVYYASAHYRCRYNSRNPNRCRP
jgi:hypothetical protein